MPSRRLLWLFAASLALTGCGKAPATAVKAPLTGSRPAVQGAGNPRFLARNAFYRIDRNVSVALDSLDGELISNSGANVIAPEDKTSFGIQVHSAAARIDAGSLQALLNTYVFGDAGSPLRKLKVSLAGDRLTLSGEMNKLIWLPFTASGPVTADQDGRMRFTPDRITAAGVPVKDLLGMLGLDAQRVFAVRKDKGITIDGNTFLMDLAAMLPAPSGTDAAGADSDSTALDAAAASAAASMKQTPEATGTEAAAESAPELRMRANPGAETLTTPGMVEPATDGSHPGFAEVLPWLGGVLMVGGLAAAIAISLVRRARRNP